MFYSCINSIMKDRTDEWLVEREPNGLFVVSC